MCPQGRPRGQRRPRGLHLWSFVFGNFYFDYYSYRFGLGFTLGFELGLRLVLWVRLFSLIYEMSARTERAPNLSLYFWLNNALTQFQLFVRLKIEKQDK